MANFPRPTLNEVKQDDSIMHYVREGDFATSDIGATAQGKVGTIKSERLGIKHVDQGR
jgi:hypothetical protein